MRSRFIRRRSRFERLGKNIPLFDDLDNKPPLHKLNEYELADYEILVSKLALLHGDTVAALEQQDPNAIDIDDIIDAIEDDYAKSWVDDLTEYLDTALWPQQALVTELQDWYKEIQATLPELKAI